MKYNTVVDVTKLAQADAKAKLEALGFVVTVKEQNSDEVAKGYVVSQSVAKGTSYGVGEEIIIYVSNGETPVEYEFEIKVSKPAETRTDTYAFKVQCGNTVKTANVTKDSEDTFVFTFTTQSADEDVMVYIVVGDKEEEYVGYNVKGGIVSSPSEYDEWKDILQ